MIQQSQPAGLLGLRTKTRTTVVTPIGGVVCPPPSNGGGDEEHAIQIELLRQVVTLLRDNRDEDADRETRDLLLQVIQAIKDRESDVMLPIPLPTPETSRTTYRSVGWRPSR